MTTYYSTGYVILQSLRRLLNTRHAPEPSALVQRFEDGKATVFDVVSAVRVLHGANLHHLAKNLNDMLPEDQREP